MPSADFKGAILITKAKVGVSSICYTTEAFLSQGILKEFWNPRQVNVKELYQSKSTLTNPLSHIVTATVL